jgi:hypothetical protein
MGLKTTNYVSKTTGLTLPTAYAKIRAFVLNADNSIRVIFGIHTSRANLDDQNIKPIETVEINSRDCGFEVNRNNAWQEEAYKMARTETRTVEKYNEKGEPYTEVEYGTLYGWQDDIV